VAVGFAAEFDPFTEGHAYFVREAKRLSGEDTAVAVMSGTFTQRGEVALLGKRERTECALLGGVDVLFELPLSFCLAPAARFAFGAVTLLTECGVTHLAFGSECGDLPLLTRVADILPELLPLVKTRMKDGTSFAAARQQLVRASLGEEAAACLRRPNDILGIEYLCALRALHSPLCPVAVKRETAHKGACSASRVRSLLQAGEDVSSLVPPSAASVLAREQSHWRFPDGRLLLSALRQLPKEELSHLPEVREGLENRLFAAANADTFEGYCHAVSCRRYTVSTARRLACYALLGLTKESLPERPAYLRLLGASERGLAFLREAKTRSSLPLITKAADYAPLLEDEEHAARLASLFEKAPSVFENEGKTLPFFTKYLIEHEKKG